MNTKQNTIESIDKKLSKDEYKVFYKICDNDGSLLIKKATPIKGTHDLVKKNLIVLKKEKYELTKKGEQLQAHFGEQLTKTFIKLINVNQKTT
jgi:hypothetical protein